MNSDISLTTQTKINSKWITLKYKAIKFLEKIRKCLWFRTRQEVLRFDTKTWFIKRNLLNCMSPKFKMFPFKNTFLKWWKDKQ